MVMESMTNQQEIMPMLRILFRIIIGDIPLLFLWDLVFSKNEGEIFFDYISFLYCHAING